MLYISSMGRCLSSYLALTCLLALTAGSGCDKVKARGLAKEGNDHYRSGEFVDALAKFEAAARLDPDFPILQLHLGYTNMALSTSLQPPQSDRYAKKAIKAFARYMKLNPMDERGERYYLQMLLDSGRNAEALTFLKGQHRKRPREIKIVASLGVVASKMGRFTEAVKWYEKRASMLPREPKARYLIGTLCWQHLYKNEAVVGTARVEIADRGIAACKQALKLQPDYAEALTYINLLYRERSKGQTDPGAQQRDMDQARHYYKRALELIKAASSKDKNTQKGDEG